MSVDSTHSRFSTSVHQVELFGEKQEESHIALTLEPTNEDRLCIFSLRFSQVRPDKAKVLALIFRLAYTADVALRLMITRAGMRIFPGKDFFPFLLSLKPMCPSTGILLRSDITSFSTNLDA